MRRPSPIILYLPFGTLPRPPQPFHHHQMVAFDLTTCGACHLLRSTLGGFTLLLVDRLADLNSAAQPRQKKKKLTNQSFFFFCLSSSRAQPLRLCGCWFPIHRELVNEEAVVCSCLAEFELTANNQNTFSFIVVMSVMFAAPIQFQSHHHQLVSCSDTNRMDVHPFPAFISWTSLG